MSAAPPSSGEPHRGRRAPAPARRHLVLGGAAVSVLALTGCGVRLEEDAPDLPFLPRRTKVAGEASLLALVAATADLAARARALGGDLGTELADLHDAQGRTLGDALLAAGVPRSVLGAAGRSAHPTPTVDASASVGTGSTDPRASLAEAERAALDDPAVYAGTAPTLAAPVLSLLGQRWAAHRLLMSDPSPATPSGDPASTSATPAPDPQLSPTPTTSSSPTTTAGGNSTAAPVVIVGAEAITALRRVTYLLQVIRPHAQPAEVALADRTLAWLNPTIERAEAVLGKTDPPPVLGAPRPTPLEDPTAQRTAIAAALSAALAATGSDLEALGKSSLRAAAVQMPAHLGALTAWAHDWGVPLAPFPGLA